MATYSTSDWHINHSNIIRYSNRPFANVEEMNRVLIEKHNAVVRPEDTVIHVGDFSLNEKVVQPTLAQLHGTHILVAGNHDRCHIRFGKARSEAAVKRYLEYGFAEVHHEMRLEPFLVSHMPYAHKDQIDKRYLQYRPVDRGDWLLCGHVHQRFKVSGRMINVGVDVNDYAPVRFEELLAIKEGK